MVSTNKLVILYILLTIYSAITYSNFCIENWLEVLDENPYLKQLVVPVFILNLLYGNFTD